MPPITSLLEPSYLQRIRKYCSEGGEERNTNGLENFTEASTQATTQSNSTKKALRGTRSS
jgi:hypothetical protein